MDNSRRNFTLSSRNEDVREANRINPPVHFTIDEIRMHFDESLDKIREQFDVANSLDLSGNIQGCKTIWRSQVVLSKGLLDFFIHEISKYCMFQMNCNNWNKTEKYNNFTIPLSKLDYALSSASNEWFFHFLNDRFSRDVFLSLESMRDQFNLIGIEFEKVMEKAFHENSRDESIRKGKSIIKGLFKRRNEIAHQNDRDHATAEQNDISKEYVETYINYVESIVNAITEIVKEKDAES